MSSFKLHSADSAFNDRVDALFNSLQTVAVDLDSQSPEKRPFEDDGANDVDAVEIHSGTIGHKFRKPAGLPPKWRGRGCAAKRLCGPRNETPDYVKNPQNWTRYSMKDTKVSSDRENKEIGLELYEELRARKMDSPKEGEAREDEEGCPKIIFKKPVKPAEAVQETRPSEAPEHSLGLDENFGGTKKFRMPEYQVGQSKPKCELLKVTAEKDESEKRKTKDAVRLDYLTFEDDAEDEDN
ncbi:U5 small nuclear ribonucleoprotein TSSC4-like [Macrobrachium nipponense]|uniref:U5 small nuclear ribonucleoprotein TSSC4-like n=1 Tax=Macrobrachium nipponense TaxID=159736 RepID=UPI0030C877B8